MIEWNLHGERFCRFALGVHCTLHLATVRGGTTHERPRLQSAADTMPHQRVIKPRDGGVESTTDSQVDTELDDTYKKKSYTAWL